jgi:hypothetical protein
VNNFFGFPKPRKAGFGSPDIPSVHIPPLDTSMEDVVLEGVIVDFGDIDSHPGILDPFEMTSHMSREDINSFLARMMRVDSPIHNTENGAGGTFLVVSEEDSEDIPEPTVENAESVADMLNVMGNENEKLQNFITDAMKNIKHQA